MNKEKEKRMRSIAQCYGSSGVGPKEFAASKGITLYQLKYWISKLNKQKGTSSSFIPINATPSIAPTDFVEIDYPNGVKIKVSRANFSFLSQLIRVY